MAEKELKTLASNRKARHDYFIEESMEAGIELVGTEVKSIRLGRLNLKDSYVTIDRGQALLIGCHVSPYEKGSFSNVSPERTRRLLMHKKEIRRLESLVMREGYTLIPLSVYLNRGLVKVQLGVCKGKKNYDKRADTAARDAKRDMARAIRSQNR